MEPDSDVVQQHAVVDAFLAVARARDFEDLLAVLDPDVVLRSDIRPPLRGAAAAAGSSESTSWPIPRASVALGWRSRDSASGP